MGICETRTLPKFSTTKGVTLGKVLLPLVRPDSQINGDGLRVQTGPVADQGILYYKDNLLTFGSCVDPWVLSFIRDVC